jgi:hypothetical protein
MSEDGIFLLKICGLLSLSLLLRMVPGNGSRDATPSIAGR